MVERKLLQVFEEASGRFVDILWKVLHQIRAIPFM